MAEIAVDYKYPEELDFFEKGFGLSEENDPDEGLFSYIYIYDDGSQLIVTHSPFGSVSFSAKLISKGIVVFNIYHEYVTEISFQAWSEEKVIRIYCNAKEIDTEFRVYYSPNPRIYVANT
ncbi:hypothetical protein [Agaribacterium sp. ZY112]|uniref:hypothetical protein n=1 Tax=Agaribacterium sp. ZY112 TaxID=3233574 RepID=UPI0035235488